MIDKIIEEFKLLEEVEAMMLGGSRATGVHDEKSDYDIYVYLNQPLPENKRRIILNQFCSYIEYSNHFWELEDDGTMNNGIEVELIYRNYDFFEKIINDMNNKNVSMGYSTCFYDNLMNSIILFDKGGKIKKIQDNSTQLITTEYVQAVVDNNFPLIYKSVPALFRQVKKAIQREDHNSTVHRLSEYFAIYYDILFALNKTSHPGEKRLVDFALTLQYIPRDFKNKVDGVFLNMFTQGDVALNLLNELSKNLEHLILELGYKI